MSIKKLRRYLHQQFDYVSMLDRECDPLHLLNMEVSEIVEEAHVGVAVSTASRTLATQRPSYRRDRHCQSSADCWRVREQKSKDDWLTPPQVAKIMGVKPDKILYWIHTGQLPAVNVAKKEGVRPQYAVTATGLDVFTMCG